MAIASFRIDRCWRAVRRDRLVGKQAARKGLLFVIAALVAVAGASRMRAEEAGPAAKQPDQLAQWIAELDADQFYVRRRAAENLEELSARPEAQQALAAALSRMLLASETHYDVRLFCQQILSRLPAPAAQPHAPATADEVDQLIAQADAATYRERAAAAERLVVAARGRPTLAPVIAERLKRRLSDAALSADCRRRLAEVREAAWIEWLASDPATWPAPTATDAQAQEWVETLSSAAAPPLAQESAERELIDLVVYDAFTPTIRAALAAQLRREDLSPQAVERLTRLHDLTSPALVAEIWMNQVHHTVQYLLVDVPQYPEGMDRVTHFDRIDDTTAHCVSGNSLAAGDYPVGVAFPPTREGADKQGRIFHLTNLPTPRRRLLYDHRHLRIDEERRLRELSERTTDWLLKQKRCLTDREIAMLRQLDETTVSRFAGPYLLATDDEPKSEFEDFPEGGRSRHAFLCAVLSEVGTHEVLPGLVAAIRRGRVAGANEDFPYHAGWLAVLAIVERDPWPGLDDFLAGLIDETQILSNKPPVPAAEAGGTMAAILLARHGMSAKDFGLSDVNEPELRARGIPASRFDGPEGRKLLRDWWSRHKERAKPDGA